jgi:O-antigen ligase
LAINTTTVSSIVRRGTGSNAGIHEGVFRLDGRMDLWETIGSSTRLNWAWGHGIEGDRYILREAGTWADQAHNVLLEVLLSSGVLGAVLFIIAVWFTVRRWYVTTRVVDRPEWLRALMVFWVVDSLLDPMLLSTAGIVLFGILMANSRRGCVLSE